MCGIVGCISKNNDKKSVSIVYEGLKKLEYRGYDSVGISAYDDVKKQFETRKDAGKFNDVDAKCRFNEMRSSIAIGHTRWSTHGKPNKVNSHPHSNKNNSIIAVHNGIIENYRDLKKKLIDEGYVFISETDTEVIPHYFDLKMNVEKLTPKEAIINFLDDAKGTFAIALMIKGDNKIYAMKRDSPLVFGISDDHYILASDIFAFGNITNKTIFFEDNEFAIISKDRYDFFDKNGRLINKVINTVEWNYDLSEVGKFDHYMIKEIKEQPVSSKRLIDSFSTIQKHKIEEFAKLIEGYDRIMFVACGTSYHAALLGVFLLQKLGYDATAVIASEISNYMRINEKTLIIAISQSGETMDVISVLKSAKLKGAKIASIVNVPFSTIQRLSDISIEMLAGQEICVASTKTFTNQLITLYGIASMLGYTEMRDLKKVPNKIKKTLEDTEEQIMKLSDDIFKNRDMFVLGKNSSYPIAREFALKLKEIPYIHAEGMMGGELKHGTIALIEEGIPVISLIMNGNLDMISASKEVEARGANVIIITNDNTVSDLSKNVIIVPESNEIEFAIYSAIVGHLLSYYIAKLRGCEIDKPRNLAKSVTVK